MGAGRRLWAPAGRVPGADRASSKDEAGTGSVTRTRGGTPVGLTRNLKGSYRSAAARVSQPARAATGWQIEGAHDSEQEAVNYWEAHKSRRCKRPNPKLVGRHELDAPRQTEEAFDSALHIAKRKSRKAELGFASVVRFVEHSLSLAQLNQNILCRWHN